MHRLWGTGHQDRFIATCLRSIPTDFQTKGKIRHGSLERMVWQQPNLNSYLKEQVLHQTWDITTQSSSHFVVKKFFLIGQNVMFFWMMSIKLLPTFSCWQKKGMTVSL